jgi:predicted histone-like DNA-binding protein
VLIFLFNVENLKKMGLLKTTITRRTVPGGGKKLFPNIVSFSNIGNDQMVEYLAVNSGINRPLAIAAVNALRAVFVNYLMNGHTVQIPQLGTFSLSAKCKLVSNAKDAGPDCIKRLKIRFTPKGTIKSACKSVKFSGITVDDDVNP